MERYSVILQLKDLRGHFIKIPCKLGSTSGPKLGSFIIFNSYEWFATVSEVFKISARHLKFHYKIENVRDYTKVQNEIDAIQLCSIGNDLLFSRRKCLILLWARKKIKYGYIMNSTQLFRFEEVNDSGEVKLFELSFKTHVAAMSVKLLTILWFVLRHWKNFNK